MTSSIMAFSVGFEETHLLLLGCVPSETTTPNLWELLANNVASVCTGLFLRFSPQLYSLEPLENIRKDSLHTTSGIGDRFVCDLREKVCGKVGHRGFLKGAD